MLYNCTYKLYHYNITLGNGEWVLKSKNTFRYTNHSIKRRLGELEQEVHCWKLMAETAKLDEVIFCHRLTFVCGGGEQSSSKLQLLVVTTRLGAFTLGHSSNGDNLAQLQLQKKKSNACNFYCFSVLLFIFFILIYNYSINRILFKLQQTTN